MQREQPAATAGSVPGTPASRLQQALAPIAMLGLLAVLLLGACGGEDARDDGPATSAPPRTPQATAAGEAEATQTPDSPGATPSREPQATATGTTSATPTPAATSTPRQATPASASQPTPHPGYVLTPEEEEWCAEIGAGVTATVEMEYTSMTADGEVKTGTQNVPVPLSMTRQLIRDRIEDYESGGMKEEAERQKRLLECVPLEGGAATPTPEG